MTPNEIATDVSGISSSGTTGNINMPSYNYTYTFERMDDKTQWDR